MSDEAFFGFLSACREQLSAKQMAFNERLEPNAEWSYDFESSSLTVGPKGFRITAIGTQNSVDQTWLWAWANEGFPASARDAASQIKSLYELTGFKVFDDPGIAANPSDAEDLAACAVHQLDAVGLFLSPHEDTTLYLAVHESE